MRAPLLKRRSIGLLAALAIALPLAIIPEGLAHAAPVTSFTSSFEITDAPAAPAALGKPVNVTGANAAVGSGPKQAPTAKTGVGFRGVKALTYTGSIGADGPAQASWEVYSTDVSVGAHTRLSYAIFPAYGSDMAFSSTYAAIDLVFDDGTRLSASGALDGYGFPASARGQGEAKALVVDHWNKVSVDLGAFAGKRVTQVLVAYDNPDAKAGKSFTVHVDEVRIEPATPRDTTDGFVSHVDTRRGTDGAYAYSRGQTAALTAVPNGFMFFAPQTSANVQNWIYQYQQANNAKNQPMLQGIGISHQTSPWMGDRNQLSIMPSTSAKPSTWASDRALAFSHENEIARPDLYSVRFDNGIAAAVTPADHAGVYRFEFPGDTGSVIVDGVSNGSAKLAISADGTLSGWAENGGGLSAGYSRMYLHGQFSLAPTQVLESGKTRTAVFDTSSDKVVELRLASSFISADQAAKNLDLEVTGRTFAQVKAAATRAWNDRLGVIEVKGATEHQLLTLYSNLYRLNLYPNSQFENTGTAEAPVYRYASPVAAKSGNASDTHTNATIVDGKVYVNNGFWDTYRTAWPLYSLLYPELTDELADGFVQMYRDGGWVSRWSSPGYADLMTGTSSDVSFAEAYAAGALDIDTALDAFDAAVKNATVLPPSANVGRKGLDTSIFLGYTADSTPESVSWALEGYLNDFGIAQMAEGLAKDSRTPAARVPELREQAAYFQARASNYVSMFNPEADFFTARKASGSFVEGAGFNPNRWLGHFTEANGWAFAFHAPHDVAGLAGLYGGSAGLIAKLDEFMGSVETGLNPYGTITPEMTEARDVRMGQLAITNQVVHHIPYLYAAAGKPSATQAIVREVLTRMFVGGEIGQGYLGDEDNGEMSAWYLFSALGFYPLEVGSGRYTLGAPLFDQATVHLPGGDLVVHAPGAATKPYVSSLTFNGQAVTTPQLTNAQLRGGGVLSYVMSQTPTSWGETSFDGVTRTPRVDVSALGQLVSSDGQPVQALVDNNSRSSLAFTSSEASLTWTAPGAPALVGSYTLTAVGGQPAPSGWVLEGSSDGSTWTEVDRRTKQSFPWGTQTRAFTVATPSAFTTYRLTVTGDADAKPALAELELFATPDNSGDLTLTAAGPLSVIAGRELVAPLASLTGGGIDSAAQLSVQVDYRDGEGPRAGVVQAGPLGGFAMSAPHTFAKPGTYPALVTVTVGADGDPAAAQIVSTEVSVAVVRDGTLAGAFDSSCLGDPGMGANCDGDGWAFHRGEMAKAGFTQGSTLTVPGTELTYDLPAAVAGALDNVIPNGQVVRFDPGAGATSIAFIGTATSYASPAQARLTYADGTTEDVRLAYGDWNAASSRPAAGTTLVASAMGRVKLGGGTDYKRVAVFATEPHALKQGTSLVSVNLSVPELLGTGRQHVFAIASDGDRTATRPLMVLPAPVEQQYAGDPLELDLAVVNGATSLADLSATVNWGDGSVVSDAELRGDPDSPEAGFGVRGEHTYAKAGTYTATVTVDDQLRSVGVPLTITVVDKPVVYSPQLTVPEGAQAPGATVGVTGTGFAPGELVIIELGTDPVVRQEVTADQDGAVAARFPLPAELAGGSYPLSARGEVSQTPATATIVVAVPEPRRAAIELTPGEAKAGATVRLTGAGFDAGESVEVSLHSQAVSLGNATADDTGAIALDVVIPAGTEPGQHEVRAEGATSGLVASAGLLVVAGEPEPAPTPSDGGVPAPAPSSPTPSDPTPSASASATPSSSPSASGGGVLPWTGSGALWVLVIALVLSAGGGAAVVMRRMLRAQE